MKLAISLLSRRSASRFMARTPALGCHHRACCSARARATRDSQQPDVSPSRPHRRGLSSPPYEGSEFSGDSFSLSTSRQSSASDAALIFRIMLLRCTFTVVSVMPISPAICLFSRPSTT